MFLYYKKTKDGFTLIELLVVISIIGLLSSVVMGSLNSARAKARDTVRKMDLDQLQKALALYYQDNGSYPSTGASEYDGAYWFGENDCSEEAKTTSGPGGYIPNLAPKYISILPLDLSKPTNGCDGYLYSSDGKEYKLLSHNTAETGWANFGQKYYDQVRPDWAWAVYSGHCSGDDDPYYCWW
jgi:type II secretion system protein G